MNAMHTLCLVRRAGRSSVTCLNHGMRIVTVTWDKADGRCRHDVNGLDSPWIAAVLVAHCLWCRRPACLACLACLALPTLSRGTTLVSSRLVLAG
jgi:hypothetical protein